MLFTWDTTNLCIVFRQWHVRSTTSLLFSLVAVILLAMGYEALRSLSRRYEQALDNRVRAAPSKLPSLCPILCTVIAHMKPQDKRKQNVALYPLALSENCLGDNLQNRTVAKSCREVLMVPLLNRLPSCQGNPRNKPTNAPTSSRPSCMPYRTFTPLCSCKFLITPSWERAASLTKTGLSS